MLRIIDPCLLQKCRIMLCTIDPCGPIDPWALHIARALVYRISLRTIIHFSYYHYLLFVCLIILLVSPFVAIVTFSPFAPPRVFRKPLCLLKGRVKVYVHSTWSQTPLVKTHRVCCCLFSTFFFTLYHVTISRLFSIYLCFQHVLWLPPSSSNLYDSLGGDAFETWKHSPQFPSVIAGQKHMVHQGWQWGGAVVGRGRRSFVGAGRVQNIFF